MSVTFVNADIVAEARSYIDVPWVHQGRTRDGVDCLGLVELVAVAKRGYTGRPADYATQARDETMLRECERLMDRITIDDACPADVLITRFHNQRHIAILTDYPQAPDEMGLIHAAQIHGRVLEHRYDSVWRRITLAAFRMRDYRSQVGWATGSLAGSMVSMKWDGPPPTLRPSADERSDLTLLRPLRVRLGMA